MSIALSARTIGGHTREVEKLPAKVGGARNQSRVRLLGASSKRCVSSSARAEGGCVVGNCPRPEHRPYPLDEVFQGASYHY